MMASQVVQCLPLSNNRKYDSWRERVKRRTTETKCECTFKLLRPTTVWPLFCLKNREGFLRTTTHATVDWYKPWKNLRLWVCIPTFKESNSDTLIKTFQQQPANSVHFNALKNNPCFNTRSYIMFPTWVFKRTLKQKTWRLETFKALRLTRFEQQKGASCRPWIAKLTLH